MSDLADRQGVADTLLRYASSLDSFDSDGLRAVFAEDAQFRSVPMLAVGQGRTTNGSPPVVVQGADAIVSFIEAMSEPLVWQHHMLSVYDVSLSNATAQALTYLVSHKTRTDTPDEVTVVTGRYRDSLIRVDGRWQIEDKLMEIGWMETRSMAQQPLISAYLERVAHSVRSLTDAR